MLTATIKPCYLDRPWPLCAMMLTIAGHKDGRGGMTGQSQLQLQAPHMYQYRMTKSESCLNPT
jgi:hypothetical protein